MQFLRQILDLILTPLRALLSSPLALLSAPKRMMRMSLPLRVAVFVEIFLLICTVTAYIVFLLTKDSAGSEAWLTPSRYIPIILLLIAIPFVVHKALSLWLEGEQSRFPDIDRDWKAGLAALQSLGMELGEIPIFLVTGVRDERQAAALFHAAQLSLRVHDVPDGPGALHWFANPDGIFLVCTEVGRLSKLSALFASGAGVVTLDPVAGGDNRARNVYGTMVAGGGPPSGSSEPSESEPAPEPAEERPRTVFGTMVAMAKSVVLPSSRKKEGGTPGAVKLTQAQAKEQTARLEYLCQLLRRARQPVCPINGILTVFPFNLVQRDGTDVKSASREDLLAIRRTLQLRCPAVALVAGMESETGFQELVSRVGERAQAQRFGKGFNVWNVPTSDQIEAVSKHACGAFEDFTYMLFREKDGLVQPGNAKLFSLLCRIRSHVCERLENTLVDAYSVDAEQDTAEPLLFGGCYFAATGESPDRQAFVSGVIAKLQGEESELAWTEAALAEDGRYHQMASTALVLSSLLLISLIGMLSYRFFPW